MYLNMTTMQCAIDTDCVGLFQAFFVNLYIYIYMHVYYKRGCYTTLHMETLPYVYICCVTC